VRFHCLVSLSGKIGNYRGVIGELGKIGNYRDSDFSR
jgi:hypothetical protein